MTTLDPKYKHKPSEKHTLEEVLKSLQDLIRHDLVDEKSAASQLETPQSPNQREQNSNARNDRPQATAKNSHEDFAPKTPDSGPVNLDAVMRSLKDLVANELDVGDAPSPSSSEAISPPAEAFSEPPIVEPDLSTELISLDEALTFDESPEIAPPSPTMETSDALEFPGEISADIMREPEALVPALETETPIQDIATPSALEAVTPNADVEVQQKLLLDEAPVLLAEKLEPQTPSAETTSALPSEPAPPTETVTAEAVAEPEINFAETSVDQTAAENIASPPEEDSLPTIEVDESFDENDYFNAVAEQGEAAPAAQETADANPETTATEPAPTEKKLTLEIVNEPAVTSSSAHSVDFDSIASETPPAPATSISASEIPAIEKEPATIIAPATESIAVPPVLAVPQEPPVVTQQAEIKTEPSSAAVSDPSKTSLAIPSEPPAKEKSSASKTKSSAADNQHSFNLDDIPVLQEVVAAPAGSTLAPKKTVNSTKKQSAPEANRARDIVVRAVAKLNIEMRKSGGVGLDTKSILRLQQLIHTELEKDDKK